MEEKKLDKYVEEKIRKLVFVAKNFTLEDMEYVDTYCKERYDNNRKVMILDLIKYKEEQLPFILLNEKMNFLFNDLNKKLKMLEKKEEKEEEPKPRKWKGFATSKE
jgi:hypothetical protein